MTFAGRPLSHLELLRVVHDAWLAIRPSRHRPRMGQRIRSWPGLASLADEAKTIQTEALLPGNRSICAHRRPLSGWCDRTLGTSIVSDINEQMAAWRFLDEGEALMGHARAAAHVLSLLETTGPVRCRVTTAGSDDAAQKSTRWMIVPKKRVSIVWRRWAFLPAGIVFRLTSVRPSRMDRVHHGRSEEPHYPGRHGIHRSRGVWRYACSTNELSICAAGSGWVRGQFDAVRGYIEQAPYGHWLRRQMVGERLAAAVASDAGLTRQHPHASQEEMELLRRQVYEQSAGLRGADILKRDATLVGAGCRPGRRSELGAQTPCGCVHRAELAGWISGRTTESTVAGGV